MTNVAANRQAVSGISLDSELTKYPINVYNCKKSAIILVANVSANCYFYLSENYTAVFYVDLATLIVIGVALKPLFADKIMQWCFSYITMMNIYIIVVFISYMLSDIFPRPIYGNAYLRLILFSIIVFVFHKWVSKLYRRVLDYWHIYIVPVISLLACFLSYFFTVTLRKR